MGAKFIIIQAPRKSYLHSFLAQFYYSYVGTCGSRLPRVQREKGCRGAMLSALGRCNGAMLVAPWPLIRGEREGGRIRREWLHGVGVGGQALSRTPHRGRPPLSVGCRAGHLRCAPRACPWRPGMRGGAISHRNIQLGLRVAKTMILCALKLDTPCCIPGVK